MVSYMQHPNCNASAASIKLATRLHPRHAPSDNMLQSAYGISSSGGTPSRVPSERQQPGISYSPSVDSPAMSRGQLHEGSVPHKPSASIRSSALNSSHSSTDTFPATRTPRSAGEPLHWLQQQYPSTAVTAPQAMHPSSTGDTPQTALVGRGQLADISSMLQSTASVITDMLPQVNRLCCPSAAPA